MRTASWAAFAALTVLGTLAFPTGANAQAANPMQPNTGAPAGQQTINPTEDQAEDFLSSLMSLIEQNLPNNYQPSVGSTVPQGVQTQPIPDAAEAAIPQATDEHVVKTDDYVLIVDPGTRQVLGVISASDLDFGEPDLQSPMAPQAPPTATAPAPGTNSAPANPQ
jgi:hypothetical protein